MKRKGVTNPVIKDSLYDEKNPTRIKNFMFFKQPQLPNLGPSYPVKCVSTPVMAIIAPQYHGLSPLFFKFTDNF